MTSEQLGDDDDPLYNGYSPDEYFAFELRAANGVSVGESTGAINIETVYDLPSGTRLISIDGDDPEGGENDGFDITSLSFSGNMITVEALCEQPHRPQDAHYVTFGVLFPDGSRFNVSILIPIN